MPTERRLRQIKDDKIVGYILIDDTVYYSTTGEDGTWRPLTAICHVGDSFELGIKVGDDWWYEGDIVESDWANGAITFDGYAFLIDYDTQYHARLLNAQSNMKRIGNIHEQSEGGK